VDGVLTKTDRLSADFLGAVPGYDDAVVGQSAALADGFRLGTWSVDPAGNLLTSTAGSVRLSPRAVRVLLALAERAGRVVPRQELVAKCWPDSHVGDEVLTHAVSELRRALGDGRSAPRYIETVSKSGYRLVAPVRPLGPAVSTRADLAVAVLPLVDLSPDGADEAFCAGINEELLAELNQIEGLLVVSKTSSRHFLRTELDARSIGQQLSADVLIEGSLRRHEGTMRITIHLIDTSSGYHLGSTSYDRDVDDAFGVQAEIAQQVVVYLCSRLPALGGTQSVVARPRRSIAPNVEAYDLYFQGRHQFYRGGRSATQQALDLFDRATQIAPDYALAFAGSADASLFQYLYYDPGPTLLERADRHSRIAVQIDPELPEAHASRGLALAAIRHPGDWAGEFEMALQLRSGSFEALYLYGRTCLAEGRFDKAVQLLDAARMARPDDFHTAILLAKARRGLGDDHGARAASAAALTHIGYYLKLVPDDLRALSDGVCALVELDRLEEALRWADRVRRAADADPVTYYIGCGLARAGLRDRALDALTEVIGAGWSHAGWLRHDPDWSDLRTDSAFRALQTLVDRRR
jgi:adenylate cyclase